MDSISLKAYAKINLTLDITGKSSGYHYVEMIMQKIRLYDDVRITLNNTGKITLASGRSDIPCDGRNLAYKAAKAFLDLYKTDSGVDIAITKRIPVSAGLAGGSADCAAVLKGLNLLLLQNKHIGEIYEEIDDLMDIMDIGAGLGKDVPFCISENGTAYAYGFGEKLKKVKNVPPFYVVLAKPDIAVSTAWAYAEYDKTENNRHPDTAGMLQAIENGDMKKIERGLYNVLESVTGGKYEEIYVLKELLIKNGAKGALMSGSGPSVYGLFENRRDADNAAEEIKKETGIKEVFSTATL